MEGLGQWGVQHGSDGYAGFDYQTAGLTLGYDCAPNDRLLAGVDLGYTKTHLDIDDAQGDGSFDSYYASLYGTYLIERSYLEAVLSYSRLRYENTREITVGSIDQSAQSDHDGNAFSLLVGGGRMFPHKQWVFQPFTSLLYTYLEEDSFGESGADGMDMKVDSHQTSSLISQLGLRVAGDIPTANGKLIPEVSAAWEYNFDIDNRDITASLTSSPTEPFTVPGQEIDRNSAVLRAGITYIGKGGITTSLKYSADLGGDHSSQALSGQISIPF
jgi:outer membrane autotransporter protein